MRRHLLKENKDLKLIFEENHNAKNQFILVIGARANGLAYAVHEFNSIDKALSKFNKHYEKRGAN